jgi:hypothetical protein
MIATAIIKRVETDHVIAHRAKDLVQHGLHALTLFVCWFVHVHTSDILGQPRDEQNEIQNIYGSRGACTIGRSKAEAEVNTKKRKGAMEITQVASAKVETKIAADKSTEKRARDKDKESHDELQKEQEEESEEEKSEDEADDDSTSSENEIKKLEVAAELKDGKAKLQALQQDKEALKVRIKAAN